MARIWLAIVRGRRRISISGDLRGSDLARLERACGRALEQRRVPIDICLAPDVTLDEAAVRFLDALADRGATTLTLTSPVGSETA
jgi:hypothetical protein